MALIKAIRRSANVGLLDASGQITTHAERREAVPFYWVRYFLWRVVEHWIFAVSHELPSQASQSIFSCNKILFISTPPYHLYPPSTFCCALHAPVVSLGQSHRTSPDQSWTRSQGCTMYPAKRSTQALTCQMDHSRRNNHQVQGK